MSWGWRFAPWIEGADRIHHGRQAEQKAADDVADARDVEQRDADEPDVAVDVGADRE